MTLPHRVHNPSWRALAVGLATVLTVGVTAGLHAPAQAATGLAEIRLAGGDTAIPGSYIVVLRDEARHPTGATAISATAHRLGEAYGGTVNQVYHSAITGFEIRMPERAARRLAAHPAVAYVEQNHRVSLPAGASPDTAGAQPSISGVQPNPPSWGLDRIDQRYLPLDNRFWFANTAPRVHAYVIDTGIRTTHVDFTGSTSPSAGFDAVDGALPADDCNGHGTHVAGTIGGELHGVAKDVRLVPVRVLNCAGSATVAQVIAGINWTTSNAVRPAVALLALGGGASSSLDAAVTNSINSGITYAVAGGSSASDACNYSPARIPAAITVAGTTMTDAAMGSGNYGTCLDLYAPGAGITSTWHTSDTATAVLSGSSMAAAHVAGCAAQVLYANPAWTPAQVTRYLVVRATTGVVTNPGTGSPNRLLYCGP